MASHKLTNSFKERHLEKMFPSWYTILYGAACGFLIPWTIAIAIILPPHYVSNHWDTAWVGFDAFQCLLFAVTAYLTFRHSIWTALTSAMLGTALVIDAWFDIMTARTTKDIRSAIIEAVIVEIPLALISFYLSQRVLNEIRKNYTD
jgi:hypothetical protein